MAMVSGAVVVLLGCCLIALVAIGLYLRRISATLNTTARNRPRMMRSRAQVTRAMMRGLRAVGGEIVDELQLQAEERRATLDRILKDQEPEPDLSICPICTLLLDCADRPEMPPPSQRRAVSAGDVVKLHSNDVTPPTWRAPHHDGSEGDAS